MSHQTKLIMGIALGMALAFGSALALPAEQERPAGQPPAAAWEVKAWASAPCDRCGKGLTKDQQDGCYVIGGMNYWLHKECVSHVTAAARRRQ